jgi:hypothetical protein
MNRSWLVVLAIALGCNNVNSGPTGPGPGVDAPTHHGTDGPGPGSPFCDGGDCVCPSGESCAIGCPDDVACNVQSGIGTVVSVQCLAGEKCEVECSTASSCSVDCAGRDDCEVTCPGTACTVVNIPITDPNVSCGNPPTLPTRSGTTARCP